MQVNRHEQTMVTFSESFTRFLIDQEAKGSDVARLLLHARDRMPYWPAYQNVLTNKEIDYLTLRNDGTISYLPAGKEHRVNPCGDWAREGRQNGKPGKIIRKIFTDKILRFIPAKSLEAFGNAYKAKSMNNGFHFEIRPNTEIKKVYCMARAEGEASLNGSCMNGDSDYLNIYAQHKKLRIVIMVHTESGDLCGRALLWDVNHDKHGDITFMDRVYVVEDYMYDLFLDYAAENSWWRKENYKKYENKTTWVNPKTDQSETMKVTIKLNTDHSEYPYIDTFSYGEDGCIFNSGSYTYLYNNTDGTRDGDEREDDHNGQTYDDVAEEWIDEEDAVVLSSLSCTRRYRGVWTHINNTVEAYVTRGNTERFRDNDENITEIKGRWYHTDYPGLVCKYNGDWAFQDDCIQCETDNEWYDEDDDDLVKSADGLYFLRSDDDVVYVANKNSSEGTYQYLPDHNEDIVESVEGYYYWRTDKRVRKIKLKKHGECTVTWSLKTDLIKFRRRYYHRTDERVATFPSK